MALYYIFGFFEVENRASTQPTPRSKRITHDNCPAPEKRVPLVRGLPLGLARPLSYSHLLFNPTLALVVLVGVFAFPAASNSLMLSGELRAEV